MTNRDYHKSGVKYIKQDNEGGASLDNLSLRTGLYVSDENYKQKPPYDSNVIHVSSKGPACLYLEADTDDVLEDDVPVLICTQDGGDVGFFIEGAATSNYMKFVSTPSTASNIGQFDFFTGILVPKTASDLPTYNTPLMIFRVSTASVNLNGSNLIGVNGIDMTGGILTSGSNIASVAFAGETINMTGNSGRISTNTVAIAVGATRSVTISNPALTTSSLFFAHIVNSGAAGLPVLEIRDLVNGAITLTIRNIHSTTAINGGFRIYYFFIDG